jgi:hypothetical protein
VLPSLLVLSIQKRAVNQNAAEGNIGTRTGTNSRLLGHPWVALVPPAMDHGSPDLIEVPAAKRPNTLRQNLCTTSKGKLFSVNPLVRNTSSPSPHVSQNGTSLSPLNCICLLAVYFVSTTPKLADSFIRQTQACPPDGKSATQILKTFPTTSTNHRSCHDGNHRQEPTPRSSRPTWLSITARLRSDPMLRD